MKPNWIVIGALWGFVGVGLGAFGAHGLERVATDEGIAWWRTGALYHLLHAPALVMAGLVGPSGSGRNPAGWAFLVGGVLFSGTLYGLGLGGPRWLGAVTPIGGVALMAGWLLLARQGRRARRREA
ncbi:MAG: DUF423 domain-containing protein [Planctomycetota bacterium]|jgi:uncharacterized membrane protein YgdD (TMEM256/DUF423 family)